MQLRGLHEAVAARDEVAIIESLHHLVVRMSLLLIPLLLSTSLETSRTAVTATAAAESLMARHHESKPHPKSKKKKNSIDLT